MSLYDKYHKLRDKFEILALHESSVGSFEELDKKLRNTVDSVWNGRKLPFPVLLDSSGETTRAWGVAHYPTTILLDPTGKLLRGGSEEMLDTILHGLTGE
jgi:hypothetical protein